MDRVTADWTRLGVMLNVQPAEQTPDIELLLLDTARVGPGNSRLIVLSASWLALYGDVINGDRLARLIGDKLEPDVQPVLGFTLEWARDHADTKSLRFDAAIGSLRVTDNPRALADIEQSNATFSRLAEERASTLSRKWGRWFIDFEIKRSAIRPIEWIVDQNHTLFDRLKSAGV
jgi:hypothetical protein